MVSAALAAVIYRLILPRKLFQPECWGLELCAWTTFKFLVLITNTHTVIRSPVCILLVYIFLWSRVLIYSFRIFLETRL